MGPIGHRRGYRATTQPRVARADHRDREDQSVIQEPIQPTSSPSTAARPGRPRTWRDSRLWIALIVALVLAIPVVVAVAARGAGPERPLGVGASAAPAASAERDDDGDDQGNGNGAQGPKPGKELEGNDGASARGPITITAIDGNKVSLKTADGWTRTITTTS